MDRFLVSWRLYRFQNSSVSASFSVCEADCGEGGEAEATEEVEVEEDVDNDEAVAGRDLALFWYFCRIIAYLEPAEPGEKDWKVLLTSRGLT